MFVRVLAFQENPCVNDFPLCFPTTVRLRVSFSPAPECVDADCWNRFLRPPRGTRNAVIIVLLLIILLYVYYKVANRTSGAKL